MKNKIVCPKCKNKTLGILVDTHGCSKNGFECWCETCRLFFGWVELKEHWGIDIGDFYDVDTVSEPEFDDFEKFVRECFGILFLLSFNPFPEGTTNHGIDIGLNGYPV